MSSFYSSAAKVVPECLSSPSHALFTQIPKKSMDSSSSPDLPIKPLLHHHHNLSPSSPPDDFIKPMILTFDEKIRLNPGLISSATADHHQSLDGSTNPDYDQNQQVISRTADRASDSPAEGELWPKDGELWPKRTELDDRPSSPSAVKQQVMRDHPKQSELTDRPPISQSESKTQVITEPAYLFPKQRGLNVDRPSSPHSFKFDKMQAIREPAYQTEQQGNLRPSSPRPYQLDAIKPWMQVITEPDYKEAQAKSDEGNKAKLGETMSEGAYEALTRDEKLVLEMKESYRSSARGRLSRVVEESESFSRREFGGNMLSYMSTHSSANHAANLSTQASFIHSNLSHKHPSYHHNNHSNFSYTHSSYQPSNFINSKSAPAGSAARTRSAFALFRRGSSEGGGKLGAAGGRVVYRRPKLRKTKSLGHTLLWPLLKIRNGYVGCMMGLEGTGDLSGMAQGGTYATRARYFADVPLSKTDSRNHG